MSRTVLDVNLYAHANFRNARTYLYVLTSGESNIFLIYLFIDVLKRVYES